MLNFKSEIIIKKIDAKNKNQLSNINAQKSSSHTSNQKQSHTFMQSRHHL